MLSSAIGISNSSRWVKMEKTCDLINNFNIGLSFSKTEIVTPDMVNNRTPVGMFIVSTPALTEAVQRHICDNVQYSIPRKHFALTTGTTVNHRTPLKVGEQMRMDAKVKQVNNDKIDFDFLITSKTGQKQNVVADGVCTVKIIATE